MHEPVAVVGAGVVGLAASLQLLRVGFDVTVIADVWTPDTTSDGAGALWELRSPRHATWARDTHAHYAALIGAGLGMEAGVGFIEGSDYSCDRQEPLGVRDALRFRRATRDEVEAARVRTGLPFVSGCFWTSVIADSPVYLQWLMRCVRDAGGRFVKRRVESLSSLAPAFALVVNCTGLGARELGADASCVAYRGQLRRVWAPHIRKFSVADGAPGAAWTGTYVLPRPTSGVVSCGGTYERGAEGTDVDAATAASIWERCCALVPELRDPRTVILDDWVGLRPGRDGDVRLETELLRVHEDISEGVPAATLPVIHCYGHGGCGHSLHWGCAREVVALAVRERERGSLTRSLRLARGGPAAVASVQGAGSIKQHWHAGPAPVLRDGLMTRFPQEAALRARMMAAGCGFSESALATRVCMEAELPVPVGSASATGSVPVDHQGLLPRL